MADTSTPAIDVEDLQYAWPGKPVLLRIKQFRVARGERVFLRGPSGSGKSTLLGLIGGVLTAQRGHVRLLGTDLAGLGAGERDRFRGDHLGFIFQMFNLLPYLDVLDNVALPTRFSRARRERIEGGDPRAEGQRLLAALGLADPALLASPVNELSIGQQQRVAAARALLGSPEILIADEPTSALDHDSREDFLKLVMAKCAERGTTLLFVSHDTSLGGLFDRVVALDELQHPGAEAA